jgi:hypothetical protein
MNLAGNESITRVLGVLNGSEEYLAGPKRVSVRAVVVRAGDEWYNHVTLAHLQLRHDAPSAPEIVGLRDAVLTAHEFDIDGTISIADLQSILNAWRKAVGATDTKGFQEQCTVQRGFSDPREQWSWPYWACRFHEQPPGAPSLQSTGPYFEVQRGLFARDLATLTGKWLRTSEWQNYNAIMSEYRLIVEDRRGRIASLSTSETGISVGVDGLSCERLFCALHATSPGGAHIEDIQQANRGTLDYRLEVGADSLALWLVAEDGEILDRYWETSTDASWGRTNALYHAPAVSDHAVGDLLLTLSGGETDVVEFKPFVKVTGGDKKAQEIAESVCAFANAGGGRVFIGVNNYGEPVGMDVDLRKTYGDQCREDPQCLRDKYGGDVQRLLRESVSDAVWRLEWHQLAGRSLLILHVQPASAHAFMIASGDVFRRVGATNRKVRPVDVIAERNTTDL